MKAWLIVPEVSNTGRIHGYTSGARRNKVWQRYVNRLDYIHNRRIGIMDGYLRALQIAGRSWYVSNVPLK